jgi:hypothetical protein
VGNAVEHEQATVTHAVGDLAEVADRDRLIF